MIIISGKKKHHTNTRIKQENVHKKILRKK
jgi:hypothetical protein